jgi:hypothetical protein
MTIHSRLHITWHDIPENHNLNRLRFIHPYIHICHYMKFYIWHLIVNSVHSPPNEQYTVLVLDFMITLTYMSSQIEISVICEVDWCWLSRPSSHFQNKFIIWRQLVRGLYQNTSWVTLLSALAYVWKCHFVAVNIWLPQYLEPCTRLSISVSRSGSVTTSCL